MGAELVVMHGGLDLDSCETMPDEVESVLIVEGRSIQVVCKDGSYWLAIAGSRNSFIHRTAEEAKAEYDRPN
jgi:hypothetical protein